MTDPTRMTDSALRRWITGTTDWRIGHQATARILDLPDEAYTEAEKRNEHLANLRDHLTDHAHGTPEWQAAASAYSAAFIEWVTAG
jgi:hypothetical protein